MTAEETIASLEAQLKHVLERLAEVTEQLQVAQARIEELEKLKTPPPAFIKATKKKVPEEQKKVRKKREAKHNRGRPRSTPTQVVEHRLLSCPDCHLRLGGISLARSREVIDVLPPPPVEVTHHRIYKGWCAGCHKWHEAPPGFARAGGRPRTHRRATGESDRHLAHGDAPASSTDPGLSAHPAWSEDQCWRACGAAASAQSPHAAPPGCPQEGDPCQSGYPSR